MSAFCMTFGWGRWVKTIKIPVYPDKSLGIANINYTQVPAITLCLGQETYPLILAKERCKFQLESSNTDGMNCNTLIFYFV